MSEAQSPTTFTGPFKGLNLSNSGGAVEDGAATVFHNCELSDDGAVVRRLGTRFVNFFTNESVEHSTVIRTTTGREYLVYISNLDVVIVPVTVSTSAKSPVLLDTTNVKVCTNVFRITPTTVNFTVVQAQSTRLLIFTGNHPVIDILFDARTVNAQYDIATQKIRVDAPNALTELYWGGTQFLSFTIYNLALGTTHKPIANSSNLSLNFFEVTTTGVTSNSLQRTEIVFITWRWWAEAMQWNGNNFVARRTRTNVTLADQSQPVPLSIQVDADPIYKNSSLHHVLLQNTYLWASNTLTGSSLTPAAVSTAWGISDGSRYVTGDTLVPSTSFVTFGTIEAVGTLSPLYFDCIRKLRLNKDTSLQGTSLQVFVNGLLTPNTTLAGAGALPAFSWIIGVRQDTGTASSIYWPTALTEQCNFIMHNIYDNRLPEDAEVVVVNAAPTWNLAGAIGANFSTTSNPDAHYLPIAGIGLSSDYLVGSYHTNGVIFNNRLCLVCPPGESNQLVFSGVGDVDTELELAFFQVTDGLQGLPTDPFYVNPLTDSSGTIVALQPWQDNLFVFTRDEVHAIRSGELFASNSYALERISNYGTYNQGTVVTTNTSILYLNELGLFDLLSKPNSSDYGSFERSSIVRELFSSASVDRNSPAHWLYYDNVRNRVYVGSALTVKDTRALSNVTRMTVLDLYWNAWYTWSTVGGNKCRRPMTVSVDTFLQVIGNIVVTHYYPDYMDFVQDWPAAAPFEFRTGQFDEPLIRIGDEVAVPAFTPLVSVYPTLVPAPQSFFAGSLPVWNPPTFTASVVNNSFVTANATTFDVQRYCIPVTPQILPTYVQSVSATVNCVMATRKKTATPLYFQVGRIDGQIKTQGRYYQATNNTGVVAGDLAGVPYPSVFRSPVYNLESYGRLKLMKKLHLLFDTTITGEISRRLPTADYRSFRNAAFVAVNPAYNLDPAACQTETYVGEDLNPSIAPYVPFAESVERILKTFTLQGTGGDYQFTVHSVGIEPFKVCGYEWEVQPQRHKRYTRGD